MTSFVRYLRLAVTLALCFLCIVQMGEIQDLRADFFRQARSIAHLQDLALLQSRLAVGLLSTNGAPCFWIPVDPFAFSQLLHRGQKPKKLEVQ